MFATISSSGRIRRSISTRGRAVTNDWRISMARVIVGYRATIVVAINDRCTISYCARRPIIQSIVATDRAINRDVRRPMVRLIVAFCDRSCDQSCHPTCDQSYEHWWHPIERTISRGLQRSIARSIVASCDRSLQPTTDRTINRGNRGTQRPITRSIAASWDRPYDQSCDYRSATIHNWWCHHVQLVVRSRKTYLRPLTIWNRRLEVLNMTIDLVTTHFALAITNDLCDQSYVLSRTCPRFQHFSVQVGRNLVVSPV